jgi:signal transduction histidine kinase
MSSKKLTANQLEQLLSLETSAEELNTSSPDSPLLHLLASLDRSVLTQSMQEQLYEPGDIIFQEGERGDALYLIWSGKISVVKGALDAPTILGNRGPGEIIGEMALLENQPRSATNIAVEPSRLLRIGRENFQNWVSGNSAIGMSIMSALSARLRDADNVRTTALQGGQQLVQQVTRLESEKEQLLELQRVRKETSDLIVHDLRNPLGIIYGVLNMFEMVLPDEVLKDNRELLGLANKACERMQRLVDSLLDVAKLETGEISLALSVTDLRPLLEEAIKREHLSAQDQGVTFDMVAPDSLPLVLMDSEKIDRVLANLIDNALKYTPKGEAITIAAEIEPEQLVISITDAGPGIPPEERERIFERFAQVSGSRPARRGFGLGLTFCRLTIEAHGGKIWVESGPKGIGSRFVFTLPTVERTG